MHTMVNKSTYKLVLAIVAVYFVAVAIFAVLYYNLPPQCDVQIKTPMDAYFFSVETMFTIGFGTNDIFFGNCWDVVFILTFQVR